MLKQKLNLKQTISLSPQQIHLMNLIELPADAFAQEVNNEVEENPLLEVDEEQLFEELTEANLRSVNSYQNNTISYEPLYETADTYLSSKSLTQALEEQLSNFIVTDELLPIIRVIIGYIGDSGYLERSIPDISDDLAFTQNLTVATDTLQQALDFVQQLDPAGVGARNLQECLLLQLKRKKSNDVREQAVYIITEYFDAFSKKHYDKILSQVTITKDDLRQVIQEIEKLNPRPGLSLSEITDTSTYIAPDFEIVLLDNKVTVRLTRKNTPKLKVRSDYLQDLTKDFSNQPEQKEAMDMIRKNMESAQWYVEAISQRQQTLLATVNAIIGVQESYFLTGQEKDIKPMILKDIAEMTGLNISTISRVVNSKYVATPYGLKKLKSFFSEGYEGAKGTEHISSIEIKVTLKEIIEQESKESPLTDDALVVALTDKGYPIARRTVAKYREQLGIPPARLRKEL